MSRTPTALALALGLLAASTTARADPPPPKVCVAVAGDPDESLRGLAEDVTATVGARNDLRGVADEAARRALRGESGAESSEADLRDGRRALRGLPGDLEAVTALSGRLGCTLFVTLGGLPAGVALRVWDLRTRSLGLSVDLPSLDAAEVVRRVEGVVVASGNSAGPTATARTAPSDPAAQAATAPRPAAPRSTWRRLWPWLAVGGVAAGVAAAVLLASDPEPSATRIRVVHQGVP